MPCKTKKPKPPKKRNMNGTKLIFDKSDIGPKSGEIDRLRNSFDRQCEILKPYHDAGVRYLETQKEMKQQKKTTDSVAIEKANSRIATIHTARKVGITEL